jgi:hypothetical protein
MLHYFFINLQNNSCELNLLGRKEKYGGNMIWALLPDVSKTESLLNNLYEADFNLDDISVMIQDIIQRDKIAKDLGPLQGVKLKDLEKSLIKLGLSKEGAASCNQAIIDGKVLVVMNVDEKIGPAALEMFQDQSAQLIKG